MIASHTLTYLHADGRERTLTLYSNERIASGLAALVAAQHGSAVQSPPHQEVAVDENEMLSTKDAATILGYQSDSQVRQYIRDGRLAAVWVGGQYIIRRSVLEEFRQRHKFRPRKRR